MRTLLPTCLVVVVLFGCPDPAKGKPKAVASAPTAVEGAAAPIEGALAYPFTQADSKLSWVGAKITGKHEGGFATFGGIIEVVGGDPAKSRVRVEIDMASVTVEPPKLEKHLKSPDFFAVEEWPQASFVSTGIKKTEAGYQVTGNLTLRGVSKSITFPATITATDAEVTVKAEFAINRKDFGVSYPGSADDLISDDVALKLELHARKKG